MKAIFRFVVFCFFLFQLGFLFGNQNEKGRSDYIPSSHQFLTQKKLNKSTYKFVFFEEDSELTKIKELNEAGNFDIKLAAIISFVLLSYFGLYHPVDFSIIKEGSLFKQQNRARYLLYHSYKIPEL